MDLEMEIQQKRVELREAFAAHRNAREAIADARQRGAEAELNHLEAAERNWSARFEAISRELASLHRRKFGDWRFPWRGPRE